MCLLYLGIGSPWALGLMPTIMNYLVVHVLFSKGCFCLLGGSMILCLELSFQKFGLLIVSIKIHLQNSGWIL